MDILENIIKKAKLNPKRVGFPEAEEEKILLAAIEAQNLGVCHSILVGNPEKIKEKAHEYGIDISHLDIYDTTHEEQLTKVIETYTMQNPLNSIKTMKRKSKDPLYISLMLESIGELDCTFAGLTHTTGDVILAGQFVVGMQDNVSVISSIGIAKIPGYKGSEGEYLGLADCAVNIDPSADDLASIAISSCETVKNVLGWEPRCAMLSCSTDGSAEHPLVDKVKEAIRIAHQKRPDLMIDGEFQLDSAIVPEVAAKKVRRESKVAGKANVLVFPDLNAGNIGVKLIQRFAGADAYGPLLQGFKLPISDCSRGAPVSELVGNIAMTVCRVKGE